MTVEERPLNRLIIDHPQMLPERFREINPGSVGGAPKAIGARFGLGSMPTKDILIIIQIPRSNILHDEERLLLGSGISDETELAESLMRGKRDERGEGINQTAGGGLMAYEPF